MPPRQPPKNLLHTKSNGDVEKVMQAQAITRQPLRRSRSASYHGDGYLDAPTFDLGIDDDANPTSVGIVPPTEAHSTPAKACSPRDVILVDDIIELDDWDSATLAQACAAVDKVDKGKGEAYILDGEVSPDLHTPVAADSAGGSGSSTSVPPVA